MLFNSYIFLLFLCIILPIFYTLQGKSSKNTFLLLVSYLFYGYWDWRFCLLLGMSTIVDYIIGAQIYKSTNLFWRKSLLVFSLVTNLGILGFFKYYNFFIESFQNITESFGLNIDFLHLNIILPVGISFYTFQTLSYTIDIYRNKLTPATNFIDFSLFVAFFPQLVAGPIERAKNLLPQLQSVLKPSKEQLKQGVVLIILGLFRKVMIGDTSGRFVDNIFNNIEHYQSDEIAAAIILFSIQIYADFSGYSHIARGTAKLLGVELIKNFEQPYLSKNITEFWHKWHISLSTWLKDYLYIPLGGNRIGKKRTYINLMITMILGGLWHGASWNFVIWGTLHGIFLMVHKIIQKPIITIQHPIKTVLNAALTYILVVFAWIFFRSTNLETTVQIFQKLLYWTSGEYAMLFLQIVISYLTVVFIIDFIEAKYGHTAILKIKSKPVIIGILSALLFVTLAFMFQADATPFLYFQF